MLDRLSAADNGGVEHLPIGRNLISLLDKAVHGWTVDVLRLLAELSKNFIESRYMVLGFPQMVAQARGELLVGRLLD